MGPVTMDDSSLNGIRIGGFSGSPFGLNHHCSSQAGIVFHAPDRVAQHLKGHIDPGHMLVGMWIRIEVWVVGAGQPMVGRSDLFWLGMRLDPQDIVVTVQGSPLWDQ